MKEITRKILKEIISLDNCVTRPNENERLDKIISLCVEYKKHDSLDKRNFNKGRCPSSIDEDSVPDGFEQITIPDKDYLKGYYVNKEGQIFSAKTKIFMKLSKSKAGYMQFGIYVNNKFRFVMVHKAVACTFLPNPDNLPVIHHKDHDKTNNQVDNLEWCTYQDNSQYYHSLIKNSPDYKG